MTPLRIATLAGLGLASWAALFGIWYALALVFGLIGGR